MSGRSITKDALNESTIIRIIDSTDGTPETGVVAATAGLSLSYRREGGAVVALTALNDLALLTTAHTDGGILHIGNGYYRLDPQDTACARGTAGVLIFGTGRGMVVIGTYHPLVDLNLEGQSAVDLKDFADAGYDPATNKVQGVVLVDTITTYTGNTVQTGDSFPRLGAPAGASVSADILVIDNLVDDLESRLGTPSNLGTGATVAANLVDIEAQTDDIGIAGAGLTAVPWNAAWDVEVQSEVQDAIEANNLDHLVGTATAIPAIVAGTYIDQMMDDGTAVFDRTTDSLQAIRDTAPLGTAMRGTDSAALASVCTEARLSELDAANLPTDVAGVQSDTDNIQTRIPAALVAGRMDASVGAVATGAIGAAAFAAGAINAAALATDAVNEIRDAVTGDVIEVQGSYTVQQALSIILAAVAGVTDTGGVVLRTPDGTAIRISATVNVSNNRTAMALTPSA